MLTDETATRKWDEMCEAYVKEQWRRLEQVGSEVQELLARGKVPQAGKRADLGYGFHEALAKAGVEFVMQRFRRVKVEE